ncbi:hypothetical protein ONS95_011714 [Cadophora gregata]|uniref:uncharacterized protein n=1 Tax=Cadophora gregata TaxID=51156 RepID=UPI0026DAA46B|nr:uncharacterized protein ONS95_011714 [Cadophora gregata]KAK0120308.1 hypothetical protein ONS95_011714 [Cadophora gregata]KAK0121341.1 hypothetical protein ONS96_011516 [Cadophora gregata f. sp. sojae]
MSLKASLMAFVVIGLSSHTTATDLHGAQPLCPASCIQTVTVTATASCTDVPPTSQTSSTAPLVTYTNAGHYFNASSTHSSAISYTTPITPESSSSIQSFHTHNSGVSDPDVTSTPSNHFSYSYFSPPNPTLTSKSNDIDSTKILSTITPTSGIPVYPTGKPNRCHHNNNCLRQFIRNPQVSDFCATYTTTINTATTGLPDYVSKCHADPSRISSACSCIATTSIAISSIATSSIATSNIATSSIASSSIVSSSIATSSIDSSNIASSSIATSSIATSTKPAHTNPETTKTAGGVYVTGPYYPIPPPVTTEGCSVPSVVFETYTMTTIVSVTVSADAHTSTSLDAPETEAESATSSAGILSSTSVAEVDSSSASPITSTR